MEVPVERPSVEHSLALLTVGGMRQKILVPRAVETLGASEAPPDEAQDCSGGDNITTA